MSTRSNIKQLAIAGGSEHRQLEELRFVGAQASKTSSGAGQQDRGGENEDNMEVVDGFGCERTKIDKGGVTTGVRR